MSPRQSRAVEQLKADGFVVSAKSAEIVRMTKGADKRIVMADGTQKRANHTRYQEAR